MPAFGSNGFSATKPQAQAYRQQTPAPQPAVSMPAYAQASGAGAAQPIQPATASTNQRGIIPGVGVVGGGDATKEEIFGRGRSQPKIKNEKDSGGLFSPEYSARVLEEGRKNPSSPFYQREYTAEERAQSAANIAADEAKVRQGYQKSGLSQATIDWAKSRQESDAPTYEMWQDLAANSGGRLDASRSAYDARIKEQQGMQQYIDRLYNPMYGGYDSFNAKMYTGRTTPSAAKFQFGNDYNLDYSLSGGYAPKTPEQQAEDARQMANWNKAREEATASGIDFATGRPLKEVSAPGNSGAYVVNAAGQPVSIASQREKAASEGWDYDTGRWLTTQAANADKQRRTDALIARLR